MIVAVIAIVAMTVTAMTVTVPRHLQRRSIRLKSGLRMRKAHAISR